ncbi:MAG: YkgJ family cysteine cluster protein [Thermoanaerobaculia bacterium]
MGEVYMHESRKKELNTLTTRARDPIVCDSIMANNGRDNGRHNGSGNGNGKSAGHPVVKKNLCYDCSKCPAYCCSYDEIPVNDRDMARIAGHFGLDFETAEKKYTKTNDEGLRYMRHRKDDVFASVCQFLDKKTRSCGIYEARPGICRKYPEFTRCGYYDFLRWERRQQGDDEFIPMIRE